VKKLEIEFVDGKKLTLDERAIKRAQREQEQMKKKWDKALEGVDRNDADAVFDALMRSFIPDRKETK
jgi:hypothetical protein